MTHLAIATESSVSRLIPNRGIVSKESQNLHPMALTLAIGRCSDLTPSLASGESVQRLMGDLNSQNKISEFVRVVAAIVVKAELCRKPIAVFTYAGGRPDKAPASPTQPVTTTRPVVWRTM